jgi:opacity protein-like surface antigen
MKNFFILIFVALAFTVNAQRNSDIGVLIGGAYYLGDINPGKHFYSPSFTIGGIYRYNFNKRYALRINGLYSRLVGNDDDFPDRNIPLRPRVSFNTNIIDAVAQIEFNFLPYITGSEKGAFSPYVSAGFGGTLVLGSSVSNSAVVPSNTLNFPFSAGIKYNVDNSLSIGAEWSFRKTFSDRLDGVEGLIENGLVHNNDWYSFVGVFITYKFFKFADDCPAYN